MTGDSVLKCPKCGRELPDKPGSCGMCGAREPRIRLNKFAVASTVTAIFCIIAFTVLFILLGTRRCSLYCGTRIFEVILLLVVAAVVFGFIGRAQIGRSKVFRGKDAADIGIVFSITSVLFFLLAYPTIRIHSGGMLTCHSNVGYLARAVLMYMEENDDALPPEPTWYDALKPYIEDERVLHCRKDEESHCSYVYNSMLPKSAKDIEFPEKTVLFFEGECVWNGRAIYEGARRHDGGKKGRIEDVRVGVSFLDGHARIYRGVPPLLPPKKDDPYWKCFE